MKNTLAVNGLSSATGGGVTGNIARSSVGRPGSIGVSICMRENVRLRHPCQYLNSPRKMATGLSYVLVTQKSIMMPVAG